MQKYYNNSIMSKFIKNLLYKTYIPICKTVKTGDFLLEGWDYVYETNWIKCTKTGYLGGKYNQDIIYGPTWGPGGGKNLLQNTGSTATNRGITFTVNSDGTVDVSGTNNGTNYSEFIINAAFPTENGVSYTISGGVSENVFIRYPNAGVNDTGSGATFTGDGTTHSIRIRVLVNTAITGTIKVKPMICLSTATDPTTFAPYEKSVPDIKSITEKNVEYASYIRIAPYEFGRLYNKLTQNYISKYGYYDVETHEYLGDFLRAIRDVKGINLMPFYNLYTDEFITNYRISEQGLDPYLTDSFKILKVPIKFNQKYTIALDCPSEVWICPAFFRKDTPLTTKRQSGTEVSYTQLLNEYGHYIQNYSSMSFKVPILFEVQNTSLGTTYKSNVDKSDAEYFQQYEKDLCLLVQIPSDNKSSIVVLEGDYTNIPQEYVVNRNEVYKLHESEISDFLISNLSLLQFSTKENYVYSDRLIEYLLWNVITSQEEIVQNIELVQDLTPSARYGHTIFGIWDKALRFKVYDFSTQSSGTKNIDLNGFVDKDTEKLLVKQLF